MISEDQNMLFQLVLDSIPVRVFWKDRESRYLGCNHLFAKDAGQQSPVDMLGKNDYEFPWHDQAEIYRADDARVMESGIAKINYEEPQNTPDGNLIWLRTSKVPLKDKEGNIFGVMGCYEEITEQKRLMASLVENANFLQALLNAIPSPIFYKDEKGIYLGCNKAFETYVGKDSDEIVGKTVFDMASREFAEKYHKMDSDLFREGGKQVYESQIMHADGSKHDVQLNKAAFKKTDGSLGGLIGVMLDITERKQAEDLIHMLLESTVGVRGQELFNQVVKGFCDCLDIDCAIIGELEENGRVKVLSMFIDGDYVEGYSYTLSGAPCEAVTKKGFKFFSEGVQGLFPQDKDLVEMKAEGYIGIPLEDNEGKVFGVFCALSRKKLELPKKTKDVFEITAPRIASEMMQQKVERRLEESEKKYRNLAESLSQLVYCANPETLTATYVNKSIEKTYGYTSEEWLANPSLWKDTIHPDDKDRVFSMLDIAIEKKEDSIIEYRIVRKDGSVRWIIDRFSWEKDEQGNIVSLNGVMSDITEKKISEEALKKSYEEIRKSREQLRSLSSHLQLISEEERKAIAREVHDEVGQALTALKMGLSVMKKKLPSETSTIEENIELVEGTLRSVKRIVKELRPELLDELGLMAAIEVYVNDFKNRSNIDCQLLSKWHGEELEADISIGLFRIVQEGLTNVLRHSGASRLRIKLYKKTEDLILIISDNGKGIDKKSIETAASTGIIGMKERTTLLNGTFVIRGINGVGTFIKISIPLNNKGGS